MQMKKYSFILSLLAPLFPLYAEMNSGYDEHWSFLVDWTYLRRSEVPHKAIVQGVSNATGQLQTKNLLSAKDLLKKFDWETGIRGSITYNSCEEASLEALYLYVYPWEGEESIKANLISLNEPNLASIIPLNFLSILPIQVTARINASYHSRLQNAELNYWRHLTPIRVNYFSFSWILGFRYINLRETLDVHYKAGPLRAKHHIHTLNQLYGMQMGGVVEVNPTKHWTWMVAVKGAGFLNVANNKDYFAAGIIQLINYEKRKWAPTFSLEGIGSLTYYFNSHLNIHVGYQVLLLSGVALAPKQINRKIPVHRYIKVTSNIIIDGGFAGITFAF